MTSMGPPAGGWQWPEPSGDRLYDWFCTDESGAGSMPVEQVVGTDVMVVRADAPGLDPDRDLDVAIDRGTLLVRARRRRNEARPSEMLRSELRYGAFSRRIPLPPGAHDDGLRVGYREGVVEVRVPLGR